MQRGGEVASRELHVAELVIGHGEIALPAGIVGLPGKQVYDDLPGSLGGGKRARRVTDRQKRRCGFIEGRSLAALEVRRHLPGFRELLL